MNNQGINSGAHSATLKGKINALEETITGMNEELNFYKKEIQTLRSEKETLEDVLNRKASDIRKNLANEVLRAEEEMKKSYTTQKNENNKLQQQITTLKTEKTNLQQHLLDLQRRVAELELQIGQEDH
ncbi:phosphoesterase family [Stylonychia lemnae]|uniref:Phosphoesterase family n=1 Tax=Stylonychia lemnae TaxID=5949 RepID=A0A078AE07_STYLE|nr:phosphoesterase family [Stylonychia lemnae]|eukprot:CDW80464.1 phosphoesterase family [Stylonychia lemnae]